MSIRRRRDRYMVDVYVNGERVRRIRRTKKEAEVLEKELVAQEVTGTFTSQIGIEDITFDAFLPTYFESAKANKAAKTYNDERIRARLSLSPVFGERVLSRISPQMVEEYEIQRQADGMSPRTINIELTLLSVIFRTAMKWGHARDNPVRRVDRLKQPKRAPRYLTADEIKQLVTAARETWAYPLVLCALHTGLRKSELFNLRWTDIDFDANTRTVQSNDEWHTKNYRSRTLELTPALRRELATIPRRSKYVFTYRGGQKLASNVTKTFGSIVERAGLERVTLHTLRHTFASHLAMQGVPLVHIQHLLSHQDYTTTLVYVHLSQESVKGDVARLPYADAES